MLGNPQSYQSTHPPSSHRGSKQGGPRRPQRALHNSRLPQCPFGGHFDSWELPPTSSLQTNVLEWFGWRFQYPTFAENVSRRERVWTIGRRRFICKLQYDLSLAERKYASKYMQHGNRRQHRTKCWNGFGANLELFSFAFWGVWECEWGMSEVKFGDF